MKCKKFFYTDVMFAVNVDSGKNIAKSPSVLKSKLFTDLVRVELLAKALFKI